MAAIQIDSPRWRDGWGQPVSEPAPRPALRLVDAGTHRTDPHVFRRRRLAAVLVLGLVLVLALAVAAQTLARPVTAGSVAPGRQTHIVQAGDTYWSIAASLEHEGDLRVTVDRLIDANGARPLFPGDRVELP